MNKTQKALQIVEALTSNHPELEKYDFGLRLQKRKALLNKANEQLFDKTGNSDWNVKEVYKNLEQQLKSSLHDEK